MQNQQLDIHKRATRHEGLATSHQALSVPSTTQGTPTLQPRETRAAPSTYQPTSGSDAYGFQHAKVDARRKIIADELAPLWIQNNSKSRDPSLRKTGDQHKRSVKRDPTLTERFFPNPPPDQVDIGHTILTSDDLAGLYGGDSRLSAKGPRTKAGRLRTILKQGWVGMPKTAEEEGKPVEEKDIVPVFVKILNAVISHCGKRDTRVAIDRQTVPIPTRDGGQLKPDVFLWGRGSPAFPNTQSKSTPPSKTRTQEEKLRAAADATRLGEPAEDEGPPVDWKWCILPIEVKTEDNRGGPHNTDSIVQLGTYVREILVAQENRRFVPSLILTQCTVEFLLWDRDGVVISEQLDYHNDPKLFCRILASIILWDDHQLGFDPTVYYQNNSTTLHLKTNSGDEYVVVETLFRSYTLLGHGTTAWRARKLCDDGTRYIIVDSWLKGGRDAEYPFLAKIEKGRLPHGNMGAAPLVGVENVMISSTLGAGRYLDTVKGNRRSIRGGVDTTHTRTIFLSDGVLLEDFRTVKELLQALHDVIIAHGQAYEKAKILHRDIAPWNILIQPDAAAGSRGILIDFSCSAFINSTPTPRTVQTPGSHLFRCYNSLIGQPANTHLDDLESFYWILCFLVAGHTGPRLRASRLGTLPSPLSLWQISVEADAAESKRYFLSTPSRLPVQGAFKGPIEKLVKDLHHFFRSRLKFYHGTKTPLQSLDPPKDYAECVDYFARAIEKLQGLSLEDKTIHAVRQDQEASSITNFSQTTSIIDEEDGIVEVENDQPRPTKRRRLECPLDSEELLGFDLSIFAGLSDGGATDNG